MTKHARVALAAAGILIAAGVTPGLSADLDQMPVYQPPLSWSGPYMGFGVGYAFGDAGWRERECCGEDEDWEVTSFDAESPLAFFAGGYNMLSGNFLWGVEGDFSATALSDTVAFGGGNGPTREIGIGGVLTVRARAGMLLGTDSLVYATGG